MKIPLLNIRIDRSSWLLFFLLWITYGYFYQSGGHNENVRIDLTRALVEDHSTIIDAYIGNTADCIYYNGHFYSGKAPGASLLLVPAWWISSKIILALSPTNPAAYSWICYFSIWNTLGLLSALGAVALYWILREITAIPYALLLVLTYALGSIAFPFSTLFFGHQLVASLLTIGFAAIFLGSSRSSAAWVSGLAISLAVITEYSAALALIPLVPYALYKFKLLKNKALFIIGGLLGAVILVLYNLSAFSNPFFISYVAYTLDPHTEFTQHTKGILGVTLPNLEILGSLLIGLKRGLFICNPVLLLLLPALFAPLFKRYRIEYLLSITMLGLFLALNAGYGTSIVYAGGGASIGPRHVIPALPFVMVLIASIIHLTPIRGVLLFLAPVSITLMLMASATDPRLGYEYENPILQFLIPNFLMGRYAHLTSATFGDTLLTYNSVAFNWGKLAGLPGPYQLLPLLILWTGFWYALLRAVPDQFMIQRKRWLIAGVLFLTALAAVVPLHNYIQLSQAQNGQGIVGVAYQESVGAQCEFILTDRQDRQGIVIDSRIFDTLSPWERGPPPYAAPFSMQWRGSLAVKDRGEYEFGLTSDDGACLYVDKLLVINDWGPHGTHSVLKKIDLTSGAHDIALRYRNVLGDGVLSLNWGQAGQALRALDGEVLTQQSPLL